MANTIKISKGLDIKIDGKAIEKISKIQPSRVIEIIPDHFHGITPKVTVKEGEAIKAGTPLFYNKNYESMKFVSPVSGSIREIKRGERRKVMSILIDVNSHLEFLQFGVKKTSSLTADEIKSTLLNSGLWVYIKQRPYDTIANPDRTPKAIFISS